MQERRGAIDWSKHRRFIEYCNRCERSSTFEMMIDGEQNLKTLVCVGENRGPDKRPPCGNSIPYNPSRLYGDCMKCRQVRRAFKAPNGKAYCVYCCEEVANLQQINT